MVSETRSGMKALGCDVQSTCWPTFWKAGASWVQRFEAVFFEAPHKTSSFI